MIFFILYLPLKLVFESAIFITLDYRNNGTGLAWFSLRCGHYSSANWQSFWFNCVISIHHFNFKLLWIIWQTNPKTNCSLTLMWHVSSEKWLVKFQQDYWDHSTFHPKKTVFLPKKNPSTTSFIMDNCKTLNIHKTHKTSKHLFFAGVI